MTNRCQPFINLVEFRIEIIFICVIVQIAIKFGVVRIRSSSLNPSSCCCIVLKTVMLIILLFFLYIIICYTSLIMSAPTYNMYHYYYTCITMYQICTCIYRYCYRLINMPNRHVEVIITALYFNAVIS